MLNKEDGTIDIFGHVIKLRTHNCSLFGKEGTPLENLGINLYIRTKFCNSKCDFCIYHSDAQTWDWDKFHESMKEISSKIPIRKISVSGGEPTLYWDNFVKISEECRKYAPDCEFSMTTDGFRFDKLMTSHVVELYDYIQLSRHHYDDEINNSIFKSKTPTTDEIIKYSKYKKTEDQFQIRCNLIKNHIDSKEEVFKFLEWVGKVGINNVGIVSLMPVNDFSKDNFIKFHMRELVSDNFFLLKEWSFKGSCECVNYVYVSDNFDFPIRVYHKNTFKPNNIVETLVFDGQNLRIGFDGDIINSEKEENLKIS